MIICTSLTNVHFTSRGLREFNPLMHCTFLFIGAALHVHDMASASITWVISNLTYHPNCYMCNSGSGIRLAFFNKAPVSSPDAGGCDWQLVSEARASYDDVTSFDAMLKHHLSMMTDEAGIKAQSRTGIFASQGDIWAHFQVRFFLQNVITFYYDLKIPT